MQSTELRQSDAKASIWVALLAFAVAAFALCHGKAGLTALVAMTCGFALVFARLRQEREGADARLGLADELSRARDLFERGAHRHALRVAHDVAEQAQSARLQRAALELVAWCELSMGRPQAARDALSWVSGSGALDPFCVAAVEDACGQSLWALHLVERAARKRQLSREATLFRLDLYARLRGAEAACALALAQAQAQAQAQAPQPMGRLRVDDLERVLAFAHAAGVHGGAALALAQAVATPR
jgi:hypothetical protein